MQTTTAERPISDVVREMSAAHAAARVRSGAPWAKLDAMALRAQYAAGQYERTGANLNSVADREAKARIRKTIEDTTAEFIRWRDMPQERMAREVAVINARPVSPAPVQTPELQASALLDEFSQRGIRLDVGSKNRISVRPAHLLTDHDKARLTTLRELVAAAWLDRNQVWICE
ncbi:hypothetical protein GOB93_14710 [Acetobacter musti]|uniref:Uncharacterized protein n=1 Tax=Acetobacter musti TaxID=864732 RepID=A0ABX0JWK8_9PROT|nr:hypothetical protein [Acetobacter musti]NHN85884.1 hypothetical protein [Acetobacter musti]